MDSGKQGEAKTKGLRSKHRPRHPPFNAVKSTVSSFFSPLKLGAFGVPGASGAACASGAVDAADALLLLARGHGVVSESNSKSVSGKQGEANKMKGLRSKRQPRHPPFNAVKSTVSNFFSLLELGATGASGAPSATGTSGAADAADALLLLARGRGVASESNSKSVSGKQGEANKTKGLRSKRRPRHPPFNAVKSTVSSFFSPLELGASGAAGAVGASHASGAVDAADALLLLARDRGVASESDSKPVSGKQGEANKMKGLRSKRRPRHPPFNAAETTVYNFFSPLELDTADALLLLARGRGVASEPNSKSNMPKMHECTICGVFFFSGQALGGHKGAHYNGAITQKRKRVAKD